LGRLISVKSSSISDWRYGEEGESSREMKREVVVIKSCSLSGDGSGEGRKERSAENREGKGEAERGMEGRCWSRKWSRASFKPEGRSRREREWRVRSMRGKDWYLLRREGSPEEKSSMRESQSWAEGVGKEGCFSIVGEVAS
jgi:hypothetical protein